MVARLVLAQLPIPQLGALAPTGNVPLAAGALAVAAQVHEITSGIEVEVLPPDLTDTYGDTWLAEHIAASEPDFLGLSLYLWSSERSLHLGREVKRRSPKTRVIVGGPEVSADNSFLLGQDGFDYAVTGEAEDTATDLVATLLAGQDPVGLANVAVRTPAGLSAFGPPAVADFPLERYPSPYLSGFVPVDSERSTYVETVRGCRSHCTFCFYPKSSASLRSLSPEQCGALIRGLRDAGAREVVFLDPTFNHRPDFEVLLDVLAEAGGGALTFFAEVRAEGLTAVHAQKLARAGFTRLEIGLQSVNGATLKRIRRGGSAAKVAAAARLLQDVGIELLVDLIIGLPGDRPDDVLAGIDFLREHDLAAAAQVFPLCVLPGTVLRADAAREGLAYDPGPPYRVSATREMDADTLTALIDSAEARLGRRFDELPRPHLVAAPAEDGPPDVLHVDLDAPARVLAAASTPAARHVALVIAGTDLFAERALLAQAIAARMAIDPYATLDVVLRPRRTFPLDLLAVVRRALDGGPASYGTRMLSHRGEDAQRRIAVVLPAGGAFPDGYVQALVARVPVFVESDLGGAPAAARRWGGAGVLIGDMPAHVDATTWRVLAACGPERIAFADREVEARWVKDALGFREVER